MIEGDRLALLEYGVDSVGLKGQDESGDGHVVQEVSGGILIGVIDGLGHGPEAARAARVAVDTIRAHAEDSVVNIARTCNDRLRSTRGVVMALAYINRCDETVTWLSIGNIEGVLVRMNPDVHPGYETIFMRPGVVGYHLPPLFASVFSISRDDLLILSTDGIQDGYSQQLACDLRYARDVLGRLTSTQIQNLSRLQSGQKAAVHGREIAPSHDVDPAFIAGGRESFRPLPLARYICRKFVKGSDDALVLVAEYRGKE